MLPIRSVRVNYLPNNFAFVYAKKCPYFLIRAFLFVAAAEAKNLQQLYSRSYWHTRTKVQALSHAQPEPGAYGPPTVHQPPTLH